MALAADLAPNEVDAPASGSSLTDVLLTAANAVRDTGPTGDADSPLVHLERLPPRTARYADLERPLPDEVWRALGVDRLWTHQAEAVDRVRRGESVAVATGTASGKSLCFHAPIAEACTDPLRAGTALCLFPTKALAQDQFRAFQKLDLDRVVPATYDGDATGEARAWARQHATVLLTNPEMLHAALLPNHQRWAEHLRRLRYVVVDELHVLRGIFGSHVAHLLRRLRRVCAHYGADPTFVFCSATIGEPATLASRLSGLRVTEVTDDGSPRGTRVVALWNPPTQRGRRPGPTPVDTDADLQSDGGEDAEAGETGPSTYGQTIGLTADLVEAGHRTIAFCRSRRGAEVIADGARHRVDVERRGAIQAYRGGYLAAERRQIEADLNEGRLQGVVATNALELGIDIGGLDACVLNGFPGTFASVWQQSGRVGRDGQESLAVLVAGEDQLDQWLMAHPTELFTRPPERAVINESNPFVLHPHLACAAHELPLRHDDERFWPELLDDGVRDLVADDQLTVRRRIVCGRPAPIAVWDGDGWPAHGVGLRGGMGTEFRIETDDGELIGTVDEERAHSQVHEGASYLHQGRHYRVTELDLDDRSARVERSDGEEYTQPRSELDFRILECDRDRSLGPARLALGAIEVSHQVIGYRRRARGTGELLGYESLDLPARHLVTRGFWWTVDEAELAAAGLDPGQGPGSLHAAEHASIGMLPLFTICDRWDVGGVSTMLQADTGRPTVVIYDGYPGGAGIAELGFDAADELLASTLSAVRSCPCDDGCPSCVQSPKCGNFNEPLDKAGATRLLDHLQ